MPSQKEARDAARSCQNDPPEHQRFAHDAPHHVRKDTQVRASTTTSSVSPHQGADGPRKVKTRNNPQRPLSIITPDIRAETWEGAAG